MRLARAASSCALTLIRALGPSPSSSSSSAPGLMPSGEIGMKSCPFRPSFLTALLALHARLCVEQESFALCLGCSQGNEALGGQAVEGGYPYQEDDVVHAR